jgi:hypothetical protein
MATDINYGPTNAIKQQKGMGPAAPDKSVTDILREYFENGNTQEPDFQTLLTKIVTLLRDENNRLVKTGNTVFFLTNKGDGIVEMHTATSENPNEFAKSAQGLAKTLKNQGLKKIVSYADRPAYIEIAKRTGMPWKTSQTTRVVGGKAAPYYLFELEL